MESTKHDRIYLQVCDDQDSEWNGDVTWCQDRIHDEDVEYRRADLVEAELAIMRLQLALAREMLIEVAHQCPDYWKKLDDTISAIDDAKLLNGYVLCDAEPVAWWVPKAEQFHIGPRPFAKAWEPLYARRKP